MDKERVILDERLDATREQVETIIRNFFDANIYLSLQLEVTFINEGNKHIWVIEPEAQGMGKRERLINGYYEITTLSIQDERPVLVRIVSTRDVLVGFWFELAQNVKSFVIVSGLPPSAFVKKLSRKVVLGALPSKPKKRGPHKMKQEQKVDAVREWLALDKDFYAGTLEDWLGQKFGYNPELKLEVAPSTFYGWMKKFRDEGIYETRETSELFQIISIIPAVIIAVVKTTAIFIGGVQWFDW